MPAPRLALTRSGPVATITFTNPPHEYMDEGTERALTDALDVVDADPGIRAVVLTGSAPGVFIRHYDVGELERKGRALAARRLSFSPERPVPETRLHTCFRRIETSSKPFVAAINGTAMGGGFELALCCDLRLVEDGPHSLGLPEVNIGLLPGAGGTQRLTRIVGQGRALELMLLGRTFSPQEAVALGVAMTCVAGPVLPQAMAVATELATKSPRAIAHIKQLVRRAAGDATESLAAERTLFCDLMVDPDSIAAMADMNAGRRDIRDR